MVGEAHQKDDDSLGSEECIGVCQVKDRGGRLRESEKSWIGIQRSDRRGTEWHSKQREAFEACPGEENKQEYIMETEGMVWVKLMEGDGSEQTDWRWHVLN